MELSCDQWDRREYRMQDIHEVSPHPNGVTLPFSHLKLPALGILFSPLNPLTVSSQWLAICLYSGMRII
jgi:hypothetical protein